MFYQKLPQWVTNLFRKWKFRFPIWYWLLFLIGLILSILGLSLYSAINLLCGGNPLLSKMIVVVGVITFIFPFILFFTEAHQTRRLRSARITPYKPYQPKVASNNIKKSKFTKGVWLTGLIGLILFALGLSLYSTFPPPNDGSGRASINQVMQLVGILTVVVAFIIFLANTSPGPHEPVASHSRPKAAIIVLGIGIVMMVSILLWVLLVVGVAKAGPLVFLTFPIGLFTNVISDFITKAANKKQK